MPFTFKGGSSFVAANDFAEGSLLALSRGMPGEAYVIAGNEDANLKYAEFQKLVMAASGRERVAMQSLPLSVPCSLAMAVCKIAPLLNRHTSLTPGFAYSGSVDNFCSSTKARREIGYAPKNRISDAIVECRRFSEMLCLRKTQHNASKYGLVFSPDIWLS